MKLALLLFCILLHSTSFAQNKGNYQISGSLEGNYTGKIHLSYYDNTDKLIESETQVSNGRFSFNDYLDEPVQGRLSVDPPSTMGWVYLDTGKIQLKAKVKIASPNEVTVISVTGSKSEDLFNEFGNFYMNLRKSDLSVSAKSNKLFSKLDSIVKKNPAHNLSAMFLAESSNLLSYAQAKKIYDELGPEKKKKFGLDKRLSQLQKIEIGSDFHFIKQSDTEGKMISGQEKKYKFLLIEFWASWCGPCRGENPDLVSLYKKYNPKGFEIIGVSLDKDRDKWLNAIQKDGLPWKQVSDLKEFENEIAVYYSVNSIPFNILIDEKGKIIAKDLRGDLLTRQLAKLFKE